jgi:3-hydroxyisobutyrate dehydrogenase-like beta-hydroxyacid dehydrogenase
MTDQAAKALRIGFIGLGRMGAPIAANLVKAGFDVMVWNRNPGKATPLVALGATATARLPEACRRDAVITMLADDQAVESVSFGDGGLLATMRPGALHISCSTISVALSRRLARAHEQAGQAYVAAPVFGRPEAAATAKLFVAAAGAPDAVARCGELFDAIGQRTFVVSERPDAANLVKLSGNFLIAAMVESLGEALALIDKSGVDVHAYVDFLTSTLFNTPIHRTYGALIADKRFEPAGFAAPLGQKDIRLTLAAAEELGVPLPLASLLRDRFLRLLSNGGRELDWSAIGRLAAEDAGDVHSPEWTHQI